MLMQLKTAGRNDDRRDRRHTPFPPCRDDRERAMAVCEAMIDISAALFNVPGAELRRPGRNAQEVARVRQIAMYVTHVALGVSQSEVGRGFGRDRTTVLHACHLVEDLRDDAEFDRLVTTTERIAMAAFGAGVDHVRR